MGGQRKYGKAAGAFGSWPAVWIAAALALFQPAGVQASPVAVRAEVTEEAARIALVWPERVHCESSAEGRELLLRFGRPLEAAQVETLSASFPAWIEAASIGYDTLLLRAARDVDYQVDAAGNEIVITLTPSRKPPDLPAPEAAEASARLELLQARLLTETGHESEALRRMRRMADERPEDVQVIAGLAGLEGHVGRWLRADSLYRRALQRQPGNEDILDARASLLREQASAAHFDFDTRSVAGRHREHIARLSAHAVLNAYTRLGAAFDQNFVDGNDVRRSDATAGPFQGVRRRGEIYLQQDYENGGKLRGSLFGGSSGPGAGIRYALPDTRGETSFQVDWQRPYWEFIEGVLDGGVRDRVEVRRELRVSPRVSGSLVAAFNRYGAGGDDNVATSFGLEGSIQYSLLRSGPSVVLEYILDAESRRSIDTHVSAAGILHNPLPLTSREVHAFEAVAGNQLREHLRAEGYTGFAVDRLGGHGTFFGGRLTYRPPGNFDAQLWIDRRLYSVNTDETVSRFGGAVSWRF